jgi:hypothetical protein
MFVQRQISRAAPRFTAQLRAQAQRRFASTETENHFVRERRHVKEHAGATTGEDSPCISLSGQLMGKLTDKQSCGARSLSSMPSQSVPYAGCVVFVPLLLRHSDPTTGYPARCEREVDSVGGLGGGRRWEKQAEFLSH